MTGEAAGESPAHRGSPAPAVRAREVESRTEQVAAAIVAAGIGRPGFVRGGSPEQAAGWIADRPVSEHRAGDAILVGFAGGGLAICSDRPTDPGEEILVVGATGSVRLPAEEVG